MESQGEAQSTYEFAEFRLDARRRRLFFGVDAQPVPLTAKAFDTLLYMAGHPGRLLDKSTLMQVVWPNVVVDENNLNQIIMTLRRALGERRGEDRFIVTVPGRGYRFVADVRVAMPLPTPERVVSAAPSASGRPLSIAVLPFANLTGDPEREYFSDGMAEELIHMLTRVPGLKVSARTSSFVYKGRNAHIRDIAKDLGVAAVLEGSVRSAGERVRVTAQLVDAQSGYHVWSRTFDRRFEDIFQLQDELAAAIVAALNGEQPAAPQPHAFSARPTADVEAYDLYLQGIALSAHRSERSIRDSISCFERAIARDAGFARALCAEAKAHAVLASHGFQRLPEALIKAERNAERALALDPGLADAEAVLGLVNAFHGRWLEANAHYDAALAAEFSVSIFLERSIAIDAATGHIALALRAAERAYELAPASAVVSLYLGCFHTYYERFDEAFRYADIAVALGWPENVVPLPMVRSQASLQAGDYADAATYMLQALSEPARNAGAGRLVEAVYGALAEPARAPSALAIIRGMIQAREQEIVATASLPMLLMNWSVRLGDLDLAFDIGERAQNYFLHEMTIPVTAFMPQLWLAELRPLRADPRFHAYVGRFGLLDYWRKQGPPDDCELRDGCLVCRPR
jgi:TolB-like protein